MPTPTGALILVLALACAAPALAQPAAPTRPIVVAEGSAGWAGFRHSSRYRSMTYTTTSAAVVLGGGVRVRLNDRVFVAGDARLLRLAAIVGVVLK